MLTGNYYWKKRIKLTHCYAFFEQSAGNEIIFHGVNVIIFEVVFIFVVSSFMLFFYVTIFSEQMLSFLYNHFTWYIFLLLFVLSFTVIIY
jgi:asparagine N-glycosylation enzyme membrane subunit Stt3